MRIDGGPSQWTEIAFRCPQCEYSKSREHWFTLRVPTLHPSWNSWMDIESFYRDWTQLVAEGTLASKSLSEAYLRLRCQQEDELRYVHLIDAQSGQVLLNGKDYLRTLGEVDLVQACPCPKCDYMEGEFGWTLVIC